MEMGRELAGGRAWSGRGPWRRREGRLTLRAEAEKARRWILEANMMMRGRVLGVAMGRTGSIDGDKKSEEGCRGEEARRGGRGGKKDGNGDGGGPAGSKHLHSHCGGPLEGGQKPNTCGLVTGHA